MKPRDPKEFHLILGELLEDARVGEMKRFTQHGSISTFDHCRNVASLSQRINRRLHLRADEEALLKGAMLHDYFLYDWHDRSASGGTRHAWYHPTAALLNAVEDATR